MSKTFKGLITYKRPQQVIVRFTDGLILIDFQDGFINSKTPYRNIEKTAREFEQIIVFDVQEYKRFYGDDIPALIFHGDIGFLLKSGEYVYPEAYNVHRERKQQIMEQTL